VSFVDERIGIHIARDDQDRAFGRGDLRRNAFTSSTRAASRSTVPSSVAVEWPRPLIRSWRKTRVAIKGTLSRACLRARDLQATLHSLLEVLRVEPRRDRPRPTIRDVGSRLRAERREVQRVVIRVDREVQGDAPRASIASATRWRASIRLPCSMHGGVIEARPGLAPSVSSAVAAGESGAGAHQRHGFSKGATQNAHGPVSFEDPRGNFGAGRRRDRKGSGNSFVQSNAPSRDSVRAIFACRVASDRPGLDRFGLLWPGLIGLDVQDGLRSGARGIRGHGCGVVVALTLSSGPYPCGSNSRRRAAPQARAQITARARAWASRRCVDSCFARRGTASAAAPRGLLLLDGLDLSVEDGPRSVELRGRSSAVRRCGRGRRPPSCPVGRHPGPWLMRASRTSARVGPCDSSRPGEISARRSSAGGIGWRRPRGQAP